MWSRAIQRGLRGNTGIGENGLHKNETRDIHSKKENSKSKQCWCIQDVCVVGRRTGRQNKS